MEGARSPNLKLINAIGSTERNIEEDMMLQLTGAAETIAAVDSLFPRDEETVIGSTPFMIEGMRSRHPYTNSSSTRDYGDSSLNIRHQTIQEQNQQATSWLEFSNKWLGLKARRPLAVRDLRRSLEDHEEIATTRDFRSLARWFQEEFETANAQVISEGDQWRGAV